MEHNKLARAEKALAKIHKLALDEIYLDVPFSKDQHKMANYVIINLEKKLLLIADIAEEGLPESTL